MYMALMIFNGYLSYDLLLFHLFSLAVTDDNDPKHDFSDARGANEQEVAPKLNDLLQMIETKLSTVDNVITRHSTKLLPPASKPLVESAVGSKSKIAEIQVEESYLERWTEQTQRMLLQELHKVVQIKECWDKDGCGVVSLAYFFAIHYVFIVLYL